MWQMLMGWILVDATNAMQATEGSYQFDDKNQRASRGEGCLPALLDAISGATQWRLLSAYNSRGPTILETREWLFGLVIDWFVITPQSWGVF